MIFIRKVIKAGTLINSDERKEQIRFFVCVESLVKYWQKREVKTTTGREKPVIRPH